MSVLSLAILLLPVTTVFAGDCGHFSVGECNPANEQIVGTQPIPCQENQDVNECVKICQTICSITSSCDFFSYDTTTKECTMLTERQESDFFSTCDVVAGPGSPTLLQCMSDLPDDACDRFVLQDCDYSGTRVFNQTDVFSPTDCQTFLADIGSFYDGVMFLHDISPIHLCQLLDSEEKKCTAVAGPTSPDYSTCNIYPTPAPTTTTTTTPAPDPVVVSVITKNAINNGAVANVQVDYTISNQTQDTIVTDSNGQGEIYPRMDLLPGLMVLTASLEGFSTAVVEVQISEQPSSQSVTISLSPVLDPHTQMRLVMNWGHLPRDLDLHVLQIPRNSGATCETYYNDKNGCPGLWLDVDNTSGGDAGAETITWDDAGDSLYLMSVFDFSGDSHTHIVQSEARIALYANDSGSPVTMEVPTTETNTYSRWWIIGCMDGLHGVSSFVPIDLLSEADPSPSLCVPS